jgi:hypothetical protein
MAKVDSISLEEMLANVDVDMEQSMEKALAKYAKEFRGLLRQNAKNLIAMGRVCVNVNSNLEKWGRTQRQKDLWITSNLGITRGQVRKFIKAYELFGRRMPEDLCQCFDPAAMTYIGGFEEEYQAEAVNAYLALVRKGATRVDGKYVNGQLISMQAFRWSRWHKDYQQRKEAEDLKSMPPISNYTLEGVPSAVHVKIQITGKNGKKLSDKAATALIQKAFKEGKVVKV